MPRSEITITKQSQPLVQSCRDDAQRPKRSKTFRLVEDLRQPIKAALDNLFRVNSNAVFTVGKLLIEAQRRFANHGDGVFLRWCREEFKLKKTQVYKWIRVADRFADCPQCVQSIAKSALYLLSEAATPAQARNKAIEIAEKGGSVSHSDAKRLVTAAWEGKSKPKDKKKPTYIEEMKLCWMRLAELYARANEDEVRRFDEWRGTSPKAKLTAYPDTFEVDGREYGCPVAHAHRDRRRRREERLCVA